MPVLVSLVLSILTLISSGRPSVQVCAHGRSALDSTIACVTQDEALAESDIFLPIVGRPALFSHPYPADGVGEQSPNVWLAWDADAGAEATPPITFVVSGRLQSPGERDSDLSAMADVPAGYFYQGCDASRARVHPCFDKEFPLRQVWLDGFAIDKYEVTNGEYLACVSAGACSLLIQTNSNKRADYFGNSGFADYPTLYVSHWDAEAFCAWEDKRLPTEAEWEKAARGPMDTREWPWGSEYPTCDRINFGDDRNPDAPVPCLDDTDRVGARPLGASPYGVMDMSGNAFEWVHHLYNVYYYDYAPNVNPPGPDYAHTDRAQGPNEIPYFTIRGGSYRAHWFYPSVTHRHWRHKGPLATSYDDVPYFRNNFVGFRCVRMLP